LGFTFINSIGTGVVTNGIFFVTKQGYAFTDRSNFLLGIVLGITYIIGAMGAGPAIRAIKRTLRFSDRTILALLMLVITVLCAVPMLTRTFGTTLSPMGPVWPIWIMVGSYSTLTGVLWPMVESYLTGGRSPAQQRKALGIWNTLWSSAIVAAYLAISPFLADRAPEVIAGVGITHLLAVFMLIWFAANPSPHEHSASDEPHTVSLTRERSLLAVFRVLLPLSYVLSSALSPYLAGLFKRLDVPKESHTFIAGAWLLTRALTFFALHHWKSWYGTLTAPIAGVTLLLAGFAACTVASLTTGSTAIAIIVAGLALFGVGMGTIYTGAITYAMRVGNAQVDAGGTHEALIGVGYLLGPMCGLFAITLAPEQTLAASASLSFDRLVLILTLAVVAVLLSLAIRAGIKAAKHAAP
jgi:hypothetical protein